MSLVCFGRGGNEGDIVLPNTAYEDLGRSFCDLLGKVTVVPPSSEEEDGTGPGGEATDSSGGRRNAAESQHPVLSARAPWDSGPKKGWGASHKWALSDRAT